MKKLIFFFVVAFFISVKKASAQTYDVWRSSFFTFNPNHLLITTEPVNIAYVVVVTSGTGSKFAIFDSSNTSYAKNIISTWTTSVTGAAFPVFASPQYGFMVNGITSDSTAQIHVLFNYISPFGTGYK